MKRLLCCFLIFPSPVHIELGLKDVRENKKIYIYLFVATAFSQQQKVKIPETWMSLRMHFIFQGACYLNQI